MILRTVYIDLSTAELLPQHMSTRQSSGVHLDELTCLASGKLEESRSVTSATKEVRIAHRVVSLFGENLKKKEQLFEGLVEVLHKNPGQRTSGIFSYILKNTVFDSGMNRKHFAGYWTTKFSYYHGQ